MRFAPLAIIVTIFAFATPALADDFYIVQEKSTKKCTVVKVKPVVTEETVVVTDEGEVFTTEDDAMVAVKKIKICNSH